MDLIFDRFIGNPFTNTHQHKIPHGNQIHYKSQEVYYYK